MDTDSDNYNRRIPTLVHLCQRTAVANVDAIYSLGDLSYSLVKPILERCSVEQLRRFEQLSPHLEKDVAEIWKDLCFRKYRLTAVERYSPDDDPQHPDSWRSRYFASHEAEVKRIEEIGSRMRTQRLEADERKKEKEVKYTDRIPPPKRTRTGSWNTVTQPKSLFQKTRSDASKVQRSINTRVLPPMPSAKSFRVRPQITGDILPPVPSVASRVTVNTVTIPRRPAIVLSTSAAPTSAKSHGEVLQAISSHQDTICASKTTFTDKSSVSPSAPSAASTTLMPESPRPFAKPKLSGTKRDPMASLFVPKRKGYSQKPPA